MKLTTVSDEIIKILDDLAKRFGIAIDWTSKNVLPYLETLGKRIVDYEYYTSLFYVGLYVVGLIISSIIIVYVVKHRENVFKAIDEEMPAFILSILTGIFLIAIIVIGITEMPSEIFDIISCKVFPEKIIFEFIQTIK